MNKLLLPLICILLLCSCHDDSTKSEPISVGTGKDFLNTCEDVVRAGKAATVNDAMKGSFCTGYINGMAQMIRSNKFDGMCIGDIAVSYVFYLKMHPETNNLDNSVLFNRFVEGN